MSNPSSIGTRDSENPRANSAPPVECPTAKADRRDDWKVRIERDGCALIPHVFEEPFLETTAARLSDLFQVPEEEQGPIRNRNGNVYAARNVLALFPDVNSVWRRSPLPELVEAVLGPQAGLVRVLYFDKPPGQTWSLPWHKDLTIAIRPPEVRSPLYSKPRMKAGVPHVEPPLEVLESMLTLRLHLDPVSADNGPLRVIPGSHHFGKPMEVGNRAEQVIYAQAGDVFAMRPLLAHCSGKSTPATRRHRRILHLEFAAANELPDHYTWADFFPLSPVPQS